MHERASKSGLFLMELIIVILFFSLASAVTVQLFVKSHLVSRNTVALTKSTMLVQNYAEVFRNSNGDFDFLSNCFQEDISLFDNQSFTVYYSDEWNVISKADSNGFSFSADFSSKDSFHLLHLSVYDIKQKAIIYELDIEKYIGNEVQQ